MSASFAVQAALVEAVRADAEVGAVLGDPVRFYDFPPADVVFPFALLERAEARPWGGAPEGAEEHTLTLRVYSRYGGAKECKAVLAALHAVLHDQSLTLSGYRLVNLRVSFQDSFRSSDGRTQTGVMRVRAVTEPE